MKTISCLYSLLAALTLCSAAAFANETVGYELDAIEWRHDEKSDRWYVDIHECEGCVSNWMEVTEETLVKAKGRKIDHGAYKSIKDQTAYVVVDPVTRKAIKVYF